MSAERARVVVPVAVAAALVAAVSAAAATRAQTASPQSYSVSATLTGKSSVSGLFSATFKTSGSKGTLSWKLSLKPNGRARSAQIKAGSAVVKLCAPCSAGAHGTTVIAGSAVRAITGGKARLTILPATGAALGGALKAVARGGGGAGGGTINITPTPALVAKGKALVADHSCTGCHTLDGTKSTGPTWKGLAGSKVHLTTGATVTATDSYLVGIILDASSAKVVGYDSGLMAEVIPPGSISKADAEAIVAYIKTIK